MRVAVHELLHIIAFNNNNEHALKQKLSPQFPNLYRFRDKLDDIMQYDSFHWNSLYFGNDLMTEYYKADSFLTVFSLEFIQLATAGYKTHRNAFGFDYVLDSIVDWDEYKRYRCPADRPSSYPNWVSPFDIVKKEDNQGCHPSRMHIMTYDKKPLKNKCHEKIVLPIGACTNSQLNSLPNANFYYGKDSRCFTSVKNQGFCLRFEIRSNILYVIGELGEYVCKEKDRVIKYQFKRTNSGQVSTVDIVCPDPTVFINDLVKWNCVDNCHNNGICINGKCSCFEGFDWRSDCKQPMGQQVVSKFVTQVLNDEA